MRTLEERVAGVEGRVQEQSRSIGGLSEQITTLDRRIAAFEERMDRRFEALEARFTSFEETVDRRFETLEAKMDRRFEALEARVTSFEQRVDRRFEALERKFSWLVGMQVTTLVAVLGVVLAAALAG